MSTDLRNQIAEYGSQLRTDRDPIDMAAVLERAERVRPVDQPPRAVRSIRRWRGAVVAAAAAVAVLILIGAPFLLRSNDPTSPPATTDSTVPTTTVATDDTAPPTTVDSTPTDAVAANPTEPAALTVDTLETATLVDEWFEVPTLRGSQYEQIWSLRNGGFIVYDPGFDEVSDYNGALRPFLEGSTEPLSDPVESVQVSSDGITWTTVPTDQFDGMWTIGEFQHTNSAPTLYVTAAPSDIRSDRVLPPSRSATWATDDGETWYEVLIDGRSSGTWFHDWEQIGNTVVATLSHGALVSYDDGRTFATIAGEPFDTDNYATRSLFTYEDAFRLVAWGDESLGNSGHPTLWESLDGSNWTNLGETNGLDLRTDNRSFAFGSIEQLPNGSLMLIGRDDIGSLEPGDSVSYLLESEDGGTSWIPTQGIPRFDPPVLEGRIPMEYAYSPTTVDGWFVIPADAATLATDGDGWVLLETPGDFNYVTGRLLRARDRFATERWFAAVSRP